jgi:hypothetical protein
MDPIIIVVVLVILSIIGSGLTYVFYFRKKEVVVVKAVAAATEAVLTDGGKANFLSHLKNDPEAIATIKEKLKEDVEFKNAFTTSVATDPAFGAKILESADNNPDFKILLDSMKTEILEKYNSLQTLVGSESLSINATITEKYTELKTLIDKNYTSANADIVAKYIELKLLIASSIVPVSADVLKKYNEVKTLIDAKIAPINADILKKYNELNTLVSSNLKTVNDDSVKKYTELKSLVTSESLVTAENSTNNIKKYSMWCADGTYNCNIPATSSGISINKGKNIHFGADLGAEKEVNAGKIGYALFGTGKALDIVGAGIDTKDRRVSIYDNLAVGNSISVPQISFGNFVIKEGIDSSSKPQLILYSKTGDVLQRFPNKFVA